MSSGLYRGEPPPCPLCGKEVRAICGYADGGAFHCFDCVDNDCPYMSPGDEEFAYALTAHYRLCEGIKAKIERERAVQIDSNGVVAP